MNNQKESVFIIYGTVLYICDYGIRALLRIVEFTRALKLWETGKRGTK